MRAHLAGQSATSGRTRAAEQRQPELVAASTTTRPRGTRRRRRARERAEAADMGAFIRRTLRAMTRRATEGELDALVELVRLRAELDTQIDAATRGAHAFGYSQRFIARELGVTQQAVHQRLAKTGS